MRKSMNSLLEMHLISIKKKTLAAWYLLISHSSSVLHASLDSSMLVSPAVWASRWPTYHLIAVSLTAHQPRKWVLLEQIIDASLWIGGSSWDALLLLLAPWRQRLQLEAKLLNMSPYVNNVLWKQTESETRMPMSSLTALLLLWGVPCHSGRL